MLYPRRRWYPFSPKPVLWFAWLCCRLLGLLFGIRREGLDKLPRGSLFVIAPHVNFLDPIFILATLPRPPHFIADSYFVFKNPFLAWLMWMAGVVPVDRKKKDAYAVRQFLRLLAKGEICAFFPEGSRSINARVSHPMTSAVKLIAKSRAPVAILALEGAYDAWPRWDPAPRLPWGRVKVRLADLYSRGWITQAPRSLNDVYDFKKKINLKAEQRRLRNSLAKAALNETNAVNLLRKNRPEQLTRYLCFCPQCAHPVGLTWEPLRRILQCGHCGLELKVQHDGISRLVQGLPELSHSLDYWFDAMEQALRQKNPQELLLACKLSAIIKILDQEDGEPEPASMRLDQSGLALQINSGQMFQIPIETAAKGSAKGSDVLEIAHDNRMIDLISADGHAIAWLILARKLAGWRDYFSEH